MAPLEEITYSLQPRTRAEFDYDRGKLFRIMVRDIQDVVFDQHDGLTNVIAGEMCDQFDEQLQLGELAIEDVFRAATVVKRYMMKVINIERKVERIGLEQIGFVISPDKNQASKPVVMLYSHDEIMAAVDKWYSN